MPQHTAEQAQIAYSGFAHAARATPAVATQALQRARSQSPTLALTGNWRVWLLLSSHFQHCASACVEQVARETGSLNVVGCLASGVFSDEDWSLDSPAAVVLLERLLPSHPRWRVTLAAPNALEGDWQRDGKLRLGGIAGDATGGGPYCLWQGRHISAGRIDLPCRQPRWLLVDGFIPDGPTHRVSASDGLHVTRLNGLPALPQLQHWLQMHQHERASIGARWTPAGSRHSRWLALVGQDAARQSLLLAAATHAGDRLTWGQQHPAQSARRLSQELARFYRQRRPGFALAIANQQGGAYSGGGRDPVWQALREGLPGVPFAGFYGNGQLAPLAKGLQVLDNSVLVILFD
ncbi:FIST C-terminal domain-containing protein [Chitinilyticum piscinae]|uniref:FIST C-terminal domain-containing protein n=1 Tax=Chitinilyticum piscinae TaxID=2866724 RepID=A0A8J7FNP7_9NEIS|nr:FIST C-terminal domain-containing protein [Chitinilyticum piscinae]MBE9610156.1 FIST C-terminal domain-containing protein [Chitinilyticum piscinae]